MKVIMEPPNIKELLKRDEYISLKKTLKKFKKSDRYEVYGELALIDNKKELLELAKSISKKGIEALPSYAEYLNDERVKAININTKREVVKGVFKCKKCKQDLTVSYRAQVRCSDEPMTNFITCTVCNNRWTE